MQDALKEFDDGVQVRYKMDESFLDVLVQGFRCRFQFVILDLLMMSWQVAMMVFHYRILSIASLQQPRTGVYVWAQTKQK